MPAPESKTEVTTQEVIEQPARELSQTDHINKKLLTSLFNRLDEGGDSLVAKMLEPDNKNDEHDEWSD